MTDETIVAVFDTAEHAAMAVRDLEIAGVPRDAVSRHTGAGTNAGTTAADAAHGREPGFWSRLFGGEPEHPHDTAVYDRSLEAGSTVVTVKAGAQHVARVHDILERHNPVDIDERASNDALGGTAGMPAAVARPAASGARDATADQTLQLSEESLAVGKRAINRGTTRVRRYVVETPVEREVALHDERISVERRPVTAGRPAGDTGFSDRTVEMTETGEVPVVSKTARVTEEVVLHKDVTDRTETVRDTLRHEDVEITRDGDADRVGRAPGPSSTDQSRSKV